MTREIFKIYNSKNKTLNTILVLAIFIIIFNGVTYDEPVIFNLNYIIVNYFLDVFVNISLGYIASLIFYILVVFIPDTKKEVQMKTKYIPIFIGIGLQMHEFVNTTFTAIDFIFKSGEDVYHKWESYIKSCDIEYINYFENEIAEYNHEYSAYRECKTYYEKLVMISNRFIEMKRELLPFVYFFNEKETDLYTEIEDVVIFHNLKYFYNENAIGIDHMFSYEILELIRIYYKTRELAGLNILRFSNGKETEREEERCAMMEE